MLLTLTQLVRLVFGVGYRLPLTACFAVVLFLFVAPVSADTDKKPYLVATTGMIADLLSEIAGEDYRIEALMGPGVDPHLYKATQGDMRRLAQAEMIFYNGLHLEGKMTEIFEKLASRKPCIAVADKIPHESLIPVPEYENQHDPHVWFDVELWIEAGKRVRDALSDKYPNRADQFGARAKAYLAELEKLDGWVRSEISGIPKEGRILVTAHDAFGYFGRAYDLEVVGLQGISTATEFGLYDVKRVVEIVVKRKVKAVFVESSVPKKFVIALQEGVKARDHEVAIGGELFSDAMGTAGTPEGTYIGMVRHNVNTIASSLK